ncbi:uncharacterized protein LOC113205372 isoform X1 [Frankliniella occidentalis]|uniref:Uncharacterized protein LOC113205372 isoform X1 n=2 Tax=Frankliniella occidentalis TaxID=133901 RepID=A0A9C6U9I6_FRAOC|nr:uncharacterized protein LOC113205372 isoform X1 [Frankliniella occidentalis]
MKKAKMLLSLKTSLLGCRKLHLSLLRHPSIFSEVSVYRILRNTMYSVSDQSKNGGSQSIIIDLRSDTVTKPSLEMRKAMFEAEVGDDYLREDPTIETLQKKIAEIFGKEAALFTPSGTMSNLIAVMAHCNARGDKVLIGDKSHILQHEDGGVSEVGGVMINTIPNNPDGTFDLKLMERSWGGVSLVCIENTFGHGGSVLPIQFLDEIASILSKKKIPLHLDGARIFNAAVYLDVPASRLVKDCDSVSVCLSKGLGAPVGSLLVGTQNFINRARRLRHLLGGAMRQVGVLGAPGLVALESGVQRLAEDHQRMYRIAEAVAAMKSDCLYLHLDLNLVHTNILIIKVNPKCCSAEELVNRLDMVTKKEEAAIGKEIRIKCYEIDYQAIRFVTYNAITDSDIDLAIQKLAYVNEELQEKLSKTTQ